MNRNLMDPAECDKLACSCFPLYLHNIDSNKECPMKAGKDERRRTWYEETRKELQALKDKTGGNKC